MKTPTFITRLLAAAIHVAGALAASAVLSACVGVFNFDDDNKVGGSPSAAVYSQPIVYQHAAPAGSTSVTIYVPISVAGGTGGASVGVNDIGYSTCQSRACAPVVVAAAAIQPATLGSVSDRQRVLNLNTIPLTISLSVAANGEFTGSDGNTYTLDAAALSAIAGGGAGQYLFATNLNGNIFFSVSEVSRDPSTGNLPASVTPSVTATISIDVNALATNRISTTQTISLATGTITHINITGTITTGITVNNIVQTNTLQVGEAAPAGAPIVGSIYTINPTDTTLSVTARIFVSDVFVITLDSSGNPVGSRQIVAQVLSADGEWLAAPDHMHAQLLAAVLPDFVITSPNITISNHVVERVTATNTVTTTVDATIVATMTNRYTEMETINTVSIDADSTVTNDVTGYLVTRGTINLTHYIAPDTIDANTSLTATVNAQAILYVNMDGAPVWATLPPPTPKDTDAKSLFDLQLFFGKNYGLNRINAAEAWSRGYYGQSVTVGIVGRGLVTAHAALSANIVAGSNFVGGSISVITAEDDPIRTGGADAGTGAAGIIAGTGGGVGVDGVAIDARLMPLQIANATNTAAMSVAFSHAISSGVHIIHNAYQSTLTNPFSGDDSLVSFVRGFTNGSGSTTISIELSDMIVNPELLSLDAARGTFYQTHFSALGNLFAGADVAVVLPSGDGGWNTVNGGVGYSLSPTATVTTTVTINGVEQTTVSVQYNSDVIIGDPAFASLRLANGISGFNGGTFGANVSLTTYYTTQNQTDIMGLAPLYERSLQNRWVVAVATDPQNTIASFSNACGRAMLWCLAAPGAGAGPFDTIISADTNTAAVVQPPPQKPTQIPPGFENIITPVDVSLSTGIAPVGNPPSKVATAEFDSTHAAAAHVSGALAVLRSRFPAMPMSAIVAIMLRTATDLGDDGVDAVYGHGLLNLAAAITVAGSVNLVIGTPSSPLPAPANTVSVAGIGILLTNAAGATVGAHQLDAPNVPQPNYLTRYNTPEYRSNFGLQRINALAAHSRGYHGQSVTIGLVGRGLLTTHADLTANLVPGVNFTDFSQPITLTLSNSKTRPGAKPDSSGNSALPNNVTFTISGYDATRAGTLEFLIAVDDGSGGTTYRLTHTVFAKSISAVDDPIRIRGVVRTLTAATDARFIRDVPALNAAGNPIVDSSGNPVLTPAYVVVDASGNTLTLRGNGVVATLRTGAAGTGAAGIIAAARDGAGSQGVAFQARILPLQIADSHDTAHADPNITYQYPPHLINIADFTLFVRDKTPAYTISISQRLPSIRERTSVRVIGPAAYLPPRINHALSTVNMLRAFRYAVSTSLHIVNNTYRSPLSHLPSEAELLMEGGEGRFDFRISNLMVTPELINRNHPTARRMEYINHFATLASIFAGADTAVVWPAGDDGWNSLDDNANILVRVGNANPSDNAFHRYDIINSRVITDTRLLTSNAVGRGIIAKSLKLSAYYPTNDQTDIMGLAPLYEDSLLGKWVVAVATDDSTSTFLGGQGNKLASFSNACGRAMHWCIAAPGSGDILTTNDNAHRGINTFNNATAPFNSTYAAAAHVSGALAVLKSRFPAMPMETVIAIMLRTATDLGAQGVDPVYGHGLLDLGAAIAAQHNLNLVIGGSDAAGTYPLPVRDPQVHRPVTGGTVVFSNGFAVSALLAAPAAVVAEVSTFTTGTEWANNPELARISAEVAYTRGYTGQGVTVAMATRGFLTGHVEVSSKVVDFWNFQNSRNNQIGYAINDYASQQAGGVIAGVRGGGIDAHGVAYDAHIMPMRLLNHTFDMTSAFQRAIDRDVPIFYYGNRWSRHSTGNQSFGGGVAGAANLILSPQMVSLGLFNGDIIKREFKAMGDTLVGEDFLAVFSTGDGDWREGKQISGIGGFQPTSFENMRTNYRFFNHNQISLSALYDDTDNQVELIALAPLFDQRLLGKWLAVASVNDSNELTENPCAGAMHWCISAPYGGAVLAPTPNGNDRSQTAAGDHIAAGLVVGALAVLRSRFPDMPMEALSAILLKAATDLTPDDGNEVDPLYGHGLLNLGAAITMQGSINLVVDGAVAQAGSYTSTPAGSAATNGATPGSNAAATPPALQMLSREDLADVQIAPGFSALARNLASLPMAAQYLGQYFYDAPLSSLTDLTPPAEFSFGNAAADMFGAEHQVETPWGLSAVSDARNGRVRSAALSFGTADRFRVEVSDICGEHCDPVLWNIDDADSIATPYFADEAQNLAIRWSPILAGGVEVFSALAIEGEDDYHQYGFRFRDDHFLAEFSEIREDDSLLGTGGRLFGFTGSTTRQARLRLFTDISGWRLQGGVTHGWSDAQVSGRGLVASAANIQYNQWHLEALANGLLSGDDQLRLGVVALPSVRGDMQVKQFKSTNLSRPADLPGQLFTGITGSTVHMRRFSDNTILLRAAYKWRPLPNVRGLETALGVESAQGGTKDGDYATTFQLRWNF